MEQPLRAAVARKLIRAILDTGTTTYSQPHARERLKKHHMSMLDCENVLRAGSVAEAEWENGAWRHQVYTNRFTVVVQLLSENHLLIVTAWRHR